MIYGLKILYWDSLLYTTYWICVYFALLLHRWQSDILQQDAERKKKTFDGHVFHLCVWEVFFLCWRVAFFFSLFSVCGRRVIFLQPSKYMYVYSTVASIFLLPFYPSTFFKGFFFFSFWFRDLNKIVFFYPVTCSLGFKKTETRNISDPFF